jgi:hypothetical protein
LDSLTKFDPLMVIDKHTFGNEFSWNSLNMEIDLLLEIQPSSLDGAVLKQDTDSEQEDIVEQVMIQIGAENVLFALIDVEALSSEYCHIPKIMHPFG